MTLEALDLARFHDRSQTMDMCLWRVATLSTAHSIKHPIIMNSLIDDVHYFTSLHVLIACAYLIIPGYLFLFVSLPRQG